MPISLRLIACAVCATAALAAGPALAQQQPVSMTVDRTTISVGGGFQYLSLPDIKFTGAGTPGNFHRQTNSDFGNYSGAVDASIETALGYWGAYRVTGQLKGFFANVTDDDSVRCQGCVVIDPTGTFAATGSDLHTHTDRDVDYWGGSLETKFWSGNPVQVRPRLLRTDYLIAGADIRGIDQDNTLKGKAPGVDVFRYDENLNTTYYGGYIGFGGEYSLGFLGTGGLWERLGLRSYFSARAGLYDASTDYDGKFAFQFFPANSKLSISDDELAFIGTLSFETRKQISPRTSLSLWSDYEYISYVPQMRYANDSRPTRIEDGDAFATRTMLRLNIGFGPAPLYAAANEPLK